MFLEQLYILGDKKRKAKRADHVSLGNFDVLTRKIVIIHFNKEPAAERGGDWYVQRERVARP